MSKPAHHSARAVLAAGLLVATLSAQADSPANAALVARIAPELERYVETLRQREEIPGIAIVPGMPWIVAPISPFGIIAVIG